MMFGQLVIGPPGSGKTTYCRGMSEFLTAVGRKVSVINLDPANDQLPYKCAVDISELITLGDVMDQLKLGPNGGLIYCMEYLEKNLDWLESKLKSLQGQYLLFDCPGQVELYTHNNSIRNIVAQLQKWDYRLAAVHLVDSHYCSDPGKFISVLLTSLSTMLQVELPHVNVLSKVDLIEKFGRLDFNVDFYTEVLDLSYLLDHLQVRVIAPCSSGSAFLFDWCLSEHFTYTLEASIMVGGNLAETHDHPQVASRPSHISEGGEPA